MTTTHEHPLEKPVTAILKTLPRVQWRNFVRLYVFGSPTVEPGHATDAYAEAYPKAKRTSAPVAASNLLKRPPITAAVEALLALREAHSLRSSNSWADYSEEVITRLVSIMRREPGTAQVEVFDEEGQRVLREINVYPSFHTAFQSARLIAAYVYGAPKIPLEVGGLNVENLIKAREAVMAELQKALPTST